MRKDQTISALTKFSQSFARKSSSCFLFVQAFGGRQSGLKRKSLDLSRMAGFCLYSERKKLKLIGNQMRITKILQVLRCFAW